MRFAAVPMPRSTDPQRSPAAEFVRKLLSGEKAPQQRPATQTEQLPVDLDQRVRLLGEW
jgi:hypothetical protein